MTPANSRKNSLYVYFVHNCCKSTDKIFEQLFSNLLGERERERGEVWTPKKRIKQME